MPCILDFPSLTSFSSLLSIPHTCFPRPLFPSSLLLPLLHSFFSLSVCLGVLSLIRAFGPSWRPTPLNSSMSALHLHCLFTATYFSALLLALTLSSTTMLHFAEVNLSCVAVCCLCCCYISHGVFFFLIWLGLCLLSLQPVLVNVN